MQNEDRHITTEKIGSGNPERNTLYLRYIILLFFSILINVAVIYFYLRHQPPRTDYRSGIKMITNEYFSHIQQIKR
ncbi:MAG: hypothetical protein ACHQK8_02750 [Bacteroidia bacterium]